MPAIPVELTSKATRPAGLLRAAPSAGKRGLLILLACFYGLTFGRGQVPGGESVPPAGVEATVAYVSEVPWQWNGEQANPLEQWARKLNSEWTKGQGAGHEHLRNLRPELSWERLAITARTNKAGAFVVHGYELIESGTAAWLEELLVPSRGGKAAVTEFVILRQRRARGPGDEQKFKMDDLWKKEILVDRGGCGELVYRWIDREIRQKTGETRREEHAEYRSASSPAEAVLAVYFGEVDACVVCRDSYAEVLHTNPRGLAARLEEVRGSPPLLKHVIACPRAMSVQRRKELIKSAATINLVQVDGAWNLTVPKPDDFKNLRQLISDWQTFFGDGKPSNPENPPPAVPPDSAPPPQVSERRLQ